ncbi:MAG: hypothetical protein JW768_05265 [Chitinispirillaceae bacterium]|nr:hypothetical protein [Chitinispirillaceae bacterium]
MKKVVLLFLSVFSLSDGMYLREALDNLWFFGVPLQYHERRGYLEFDENHVQRLGKGAVFTKGAEVGKRFRLPYNFRLQVAADINYGRTIDDTLPPIMVGDSALSTQLMAVLFYGGVIADLQYPIKVSPDASWYWHAGYGCHLAELGEYETINNNPKLRVNDDYLEFNRMWSGSIHGGGGFEIAFSQVIGIAFSYSLRYWYPVHYGMVRDLFLMRPVDYKEKFFSHEIDIVLLVKRH